ncbi:MAG: hypothetical protein AB1473_21480 [Thermodesulfobacteriota bacterium]
MMRLFQLGLPDHFQGRGDADSGIEIHRAGGSRRKTMGDGEIAEQFPLQAPIFAQE